MNYSVLVADEAIEDIYSLVKYIHKELCNPSAAEKLYRELKEEISNLGAFPKKFVSTEIRHRGYVIHKKVYKTYLIFYIVNDKEERVYVLRVMKELMHWKKVLREAKKYHFIRWG